jgi:hypothetical protein
MRSLGVYRQWNVPNTKREPSRFTHWKAKFRQVQSLKRVHSLQRQSRNASGTKSPKPTLPKLRLISPTATEKEIRRPTPPLREGGGQGQKKLLKKKAASKSVARSGPSSRKITDVESPLHPPTARQLPRSGFSVGLRASRESSTGSECNGLQQHHDFRPVAPSARRFSLRLSTSPSGVSQADFFCGKLNGITFPYSSGGIHFVAFFAKLLGTKNSMIFAINHPTCKNKTGAKKFLILTNLYRCLQAVSPEDIRRLSAIACGC